MLVDDFKKVERNVYSQNGEDGIVEWIFRRIPPRHRVCVEFGAWDGRNLSNTFNLVANHGWRAVYIEADPRKFRVLQQTATAYPSITPVCGLVSASGESSLDHILGLQGVPADFDLLSIDIDGNDYDVWEGVVLFRPNVVVIEFNPTFPSDFCYIDRGGRGFIGSSAAALTELAAGKGYGLVSCCGPNLFFLREELFSALGENPQDLATALGGKRDSYVFVNYAGELVFSDTDIANRLRAVKYVQPLRNLARSVLHLPTFYVLGEPHQQVGSMAKFLHWIRTLVRLKAKTLVRLKAKRPDKIPSNVLDKDQSA
jgi:hypothetical protein